MMFQIVKCMITRNWFLWPRSGDYTRDNAKTIQYLLSAEYHGSSVVIATISLSEKYFRRITIMWYWIIFSWLRNFTPYHSLLFRTCQFPAMAFQFLAVFKGSKSIRLVYLVDHASRMISGVFRYKAASPNLLKAILICQLNLRTYEYELS